VATVLVVGADRGIAHSISRLLHERGDTVIAACLAGNDELASLGVTVVGDVDVTSQTSVDALAQKLAADGTSLDVVYHVAGVLGLDELGSIDYDEVRRQFEINTLGPLRTMTCPSAESACSRCTPAWWRRLSPRTTQGTTTTSPLIRPRPG